MQITTFKKFYKNEKFITMCELFVPVATLPAIKIVQVIGGPSPQGYSDLWMGVTIMSSLLASSFFTLKDSYNCATYGKRNNFSGYISHFVDSLFISKNKQIYNSVLAELSKINDSSSKPISNDDLKECILFVLMKIIGVCGVDKKDTWWAFSKLNNNQNKYSNFFIDEEKNVEQQMCEKMNLMPNHLLQSMFDLCIQEVGKDMGARFYLIHQHQPQPFYEIIQKIVLHFSIEDRAAAKEFIEAAKKDSWHSNQYLSYGALLNEGLVDSLLSQENIPDEILDYLIYSHDNLALNGDAINKIQEIKRARSEKNSLIATLEEVRPSILQKNSRPTNEIWDANRILDFPLPEVKEIFKI